MKHIDNWFIFAHKLGLGIEMEDIVLVTGCDLAMSWANIAFLGTQNDSQVSFGVRVGSPDPSTSIQFSDWNARGAVLRHGPEGKVRRTPFETIEELRQLWLDSLLIRTYLRINVYSSGDIVSPAPSGYCQGVSGRRLDLPQTQRATTVIQTWRL